MTETRIVDLGGKTLNVNDDDIPVALIYFGRLVVQSWAELFHAAVKCLYIEYPDVINSLCSKDSSQILFLRTNTIDMEQPARVAPIIFLETKRTPRQIVKALRIIFNRAGVFNVNMKIEVRSPSDEQIELEQIFASPTQENFTQQKNKQPIFHRDQSIEEMLAVLDSMPVTVSPKTQIPLPHAEKNYVLEPVIFGTMFFVLENKRYGPFSNEKNRYVSLMKCLAEIYPEEMIKQAGHHINSMHRLTLVYGESYLYFREPVELPNGLYMDKGFPDRVIVENEKYYLERCGLNFESVMF